MVDLDRLTKREREMYDAGLAAGRAEAENGAPQWTKPTFSLAVLVTLFAMSAAWFTLWRTPDPTVELVITLIGAVSAVPIAYAWPKKPAEPEKGG